jgi:glycyl-tRNA synthetase
MKFHPQLAPIKVAVLPLVKKDGMPDKARELVNAFFKRGINASLDIQHAIGRRYRRHDEIGTPWCLTVDGQTMEDGTITVRDRDTMEQRRISIEEAIDEIEGLLNASLEA